MDLTAIILAAGRGTRMRSDLPKVLHRLAGRPMVQCVLEAARSLEPAELAVVVGYCADLVRGAVGEQVTCVVQAQQSGTGGALRQARAAVAGRSETVLVLYGDSPLIRPETLREAVEHHRACGAAATLLTWRPPDPKDYGRIVRDAVTGRVLAVVEDEAASPEQRLIGEVSSGIFCFRDAWLWSRLDGLPQRPGGEYYLTDLVAQASEEGENVEALVVTQSLELIGVDDRLELAQAEAELRRRINERWLLAGVTLVDPSATYIEPGVEIGVDTVIWPGSYLQGQTRIGQGCTIGPGAVIRDSVVGDRCHVVLSVLESAVMDEGSDIGPFSHLRKGAHVGQGAHVGNYGEIKNSFLGPGAKMGHFSYLGDATVGADANISAGTITCNFDGERKQPTVIGDGAFVGSDTLLVAPVTVGAGAKTGAGSVVTHDVPAGALVYGVPARPKPAAKDPK